MITINLYNNKSQVCGPRADVEYISDNFKIKAKNYFWSPAYRKRQWDGYVRWVSAATGLFLTGLAPELCEKLRELDIPFSVVDKRERFKPIREVDELSGDKLRPYQIDALHQMISNKLYGIIFHRGICWAATNAGKSYIMGGIFASFSSKRKGLLLIDNSEIFPQLVEDFKRFFPDEVGIINSEKLELDKRITICMVQTLAIRTRKMPKIKQWLHQQDMLIVDECDTCTTTYYTTVLNELHNTSLRMGFTGTAQLHKDPNKNRQIVAFFGPVLYRITNKELVEEGVSTKPIIKIFLGSDGIKVKGNLKEEYDKAIVYNKDRNKKVWKRVKVHNKKGRLPLIIIFKYKQHAKELLKSMPKSLKHLTVEYVHSGVSTAKRAHVIQSFKDGKLDILLASFILKRGKNLPLAKVLINSASGDSQTNLLQIFGRLLRSHKSKKVVYMEDFFDRGSAYLMRHSKHRIIYYKEEGFKVRELYKK